MNANTVFLNEGQMIMFIGPDGKLYGGQVLEVDAVTFKLGLLGTNDTMTFGHNCVRPTCGTVRQVGWVTIMEVE